MDETDRRDEFSYCLSYSDKFPDGMWLIFKAGKFHDVAADDSCAIAQIPHDDTWQGDGPPPKVRAEYERLIGYVPRPVDLNPLTRANIVELAAEPGECGFDQPCAFGNRVEGHAVYCHNEHWLYAPRKCRRTWYTGGETRDEDCEGYQPNPAFAPKEKEND